MITAGLDLGTRSAKAVVLGPDAMMASAVGPIDDVVDKVAKRALKRALKQAGISRRRLSGVGVTGFGRKAVKGSAKQFPDVMCVAAATGVYSLSLPDALPMSGRSGVARCARGARRAQSGSAR